MVWWYQGGVGVVSGWFGCCLSGLGGVEVVWVVSAGVRVLWVVLRWFGCCLGGVWVVWVVFGGV